MSKKTFMATIFITAFLISTVVGLQAVKVAKANPIPRKQQIPPTSPITEPPKIIIQSPSNTTYYSQNIQLSFTVTYGNLSFTIPYINPIFYHFSVSYELDGQEKYFTYSAYNNQTFSTILTGLTNGNHVVTVDVKATSTYATNIVPTDNDNYEYQINFYQSQNSETANFIIDPSQQPTPTPKQQSKIEPSQTPDRPQVGGFAPVIIPASMIFLAIVIVGLLVYFRERKGKL